MFQITLVDGHDFDFKDMKKEYKYISLSFQVAIKGRRIMHIFFSDQPMTGEIESTYKLQNAN